jgi:hypothetical protein
MSEKNAEVLRGRTSQKSTPLSLLLTFPSLTFLSSLPRPLPHSSPSPPPQVKRAPKLRVDDDYGGTSVERRYKSSVRFLSSSRHDRSLPLLSSGGENRDLLTAAPHDSQGAFVRFHRAHWWLNGCSFFFSSSQSPAELTMTTILSFDVKAVSETSDSCRLACNTHPCVSHPPILTTSPLHIDLKQLSFPFAAPAPTTPSPPLKYSPTSVRAGAFPPPTSAPFTAIPLRSSRWTRRRKTLVGLH